jgi:hypothetical protein
MLIERMQTHPKDFKHDGRFARITDQILGKLPVGFSDLSDRDDTALNEAYGKYILEPRLTEFVVDEIFNGDKRRAEEQAQVSAQYTASLARSMMATKNQMASTLMAGGFNDPRLLYGPVNSPEQQMLPASNTSASSGREWFESEKQILSDMTKKTLAKLKRNKSK